MTGLKGTLANLANLRGRFERLLAGAAKGGGPKTKFTARHLREVTSFGSNPGNLRMLTHMRQSGRCPSAGRCLAWLHSNCGGLRSRIRLVGVGLHAWFRHAVSRTETRQQSQQLLQLVSSKRHSAGRRRGPLYSPDDRSNGGGARR